MDRMQRRPPGVAIGMLGIVLLGSLASPAAGSSPAKTFPEFASRKGTLGTVSLVADVIVVEVGKPGEIKKLLLADSRNLGNQCLDKIAEGMTAKGYSVSPKPLLCLGFPGLPDTLPVGSSWDGQVFAGDELPIMSAPFHADSALCRDLTVAQVWGAVITQALRYEKKKDAPAEPIQSADLREVVGTDHVLVMRATHSQAKKVKMGLKMLGFSNDSVLGLQMAVLDVRSGEVLWKDEEFVLHDAGSTLKEKEVGSLVSKLLKRMP